AEGRRHVEPEGSGAAGETRTAWGETLETAHDRAFPNRHGGTRGRASPPGEAPEPRPQPGFPHRRAGTTRQHLPLRPRPAPVRLREYPTARLRSPCQNWP